MKFRICVNSQDRIYKFIWINEDNGGVYIGYYGEIAETHISYHSDGTCHTKLKGKSEPINQSKRCPINKINPYIQISFHATSLENDAMKRLGSEHSVDKSQTNELFINSDIFPCHRQVHFDSYLVLVEQEKQFIDMI